MSKSSNFLGNTIILSIGTLGAKLVQYLLLPYYTNILSTAEYGIVDNLQNITTLLIPIVSLTISEGVFRYALDKNFEKEKVFSNGMMINILGAVLAVLLSGFIGIFVKSEELLVYIGLVTANIILNFLRTNCAQYVKAVKSTVLYTVDSILMTFVTVVASIILLSVFDMGITGYMLGYIVGNAASFVFLWCKGKLYADFSIKHVSKELCNTLIIFCIPLIPNTICWWISNCSDRFMITYFLDVAENGIYAIAYKVPTIVTILVGIFIQAWQISANQAAEDKQIGQYYSKIYKYLDTFVVCMSAAIILFSKIVIKVMAAESYYGAWKYVPCLIFAICFYSKAQLLGTIYTTFHQTKMAFVTNFVAAVANIVGNFFLIQKIGVMGAAIATAVSYVILWYIRCEDTKKHVKIDYDKSREIICSILLLLEAIMMLLDSKYIWIAVLCGLLILGINAKIVFELVNKIFGLVKEKLHG